MALTGTGRAGGDEAQSRGRCTAHKHTSASSECLECLERRISCHLSFLHIQAAEITGSRLTFVHFGRGRGAHLHCQRHQGDGRCGSQRLPGRCPRHAPPVLTTHNGSVQQGEEPCAAP